MSSTPLEVAAALAAGGFGSKAVKETVKSVRAKVTSGDGKGKGKDTKKNS
ncbi:hypothetical protein NE236_31895 [Actinoallomurus purpureus]|nr:hypothetical protein [Actinoallomurus purpureus]MCO6009584.1 hypothetical protein [Actinoallomurus purpureus]